MESDPGPLLSTKLGYVRIQVTCTEPNTLTSLYPTLAILVLESELLFSEVQSTMRVDLFLVFLVSWQGRLKKTLSFSIIIYSVLVWKIQLEDGTARASLASL